MKWLVPSYNVFVRPLTSSVSFSKGYAESPYTFPEPCHTTCKIFFKSIALYFDSA